MQIRIRQDARKAYTQDNKLVGYNYKWAEIMDNISGKILEVDTEYLFKDQFSTKPLDEYSNGLRIMDYLVEEVIDDVRPSKQRCSWCGKHSEIVGNDACPHCQRKDHLERLSQAPQSIAYFSK